MLRYKDVCAAICRAGSPQGSLRVAVQSIGNECLTYEQHCLSWSCSSGWTLAVACQRDTESHWSIGFYLVCVSEVLSGDISTILTFESSDSSSTIAVHKCPFVRWLQGVEFTIDLIFPSLPLREMTKQGDSSQNTSWWALLAQVEESADNTSCSATGSMETIALL